MPVLFLVQVNIETVSATAFVVETSPGQFVTPVCATLRPAVELLERRTVLLIGAFSSGDSLPISIEIVDQLEDMDGNSLIGLRDERVTALAAGPSLVFAESFAADAPGLEGECPDHVGQAIQLTWEGGVTGPQGAALAEAQRTAISVNLVNQRTLTLLIPYLSRNWACSLSFLVIMFLIFNYSQLKYKGVNG